VTPASPEQRTPLTLEFTPDNLDDPTAPEGAVPIVVCEPSFQAGGRIFLGVNPVGARLGVHMLPAEVAKLRDHLNKLLMEPPGDAPSPGTGEPIQSRIDRAVERIKNERAKRPGRFQFRFEFRAGKIQGVVGRFDD
jgi:hypothetical protein